MERTFPVRIYAGQARVKLRTAAFAPNLIVGHPHFGRQVDRERPNHYLAVGAGRRVGNYMWPYRKGVVSASIRPSICLWLYDTIDDEHFCRGLPLLRFQSELFPYSNEDSGFFRGVAIVNSR